MNWILLVAPVGLKGVRGAGPACFVAGTQIAMADGTTKAIEDVVVGDEVLTRDQYTSENEAAKTGVVCRTFKSKAESTLLVTLTDGSIIETTDEHPFYVEGKGFIAASRLTIRDRVVEDSGDSTQILAIATDAEPETVFNFEVEGTHTYFVQAGDNALWVHNLCSRPARMNRDPTRPKGVRVDNEHTGAGGTGPHVHNGNGPTWHNNEGVGSVGHSGRKGPHPADWTNEVKDWIEGHGWPRPRR